MPPLSVSFHGDRVMERKASLSPENHNLIGYSKLLKSSYLFFYYLLSLNGYIIIIAELTNGGSIE